MDLVSGIVEIAFIDDVVPFKDTTRPVAANKHGDFLRHAGANQIPHAGAPQIMEQAVDAGLLLGLLPRLANVAYLAAAPWGFAIDVFAALTEEHP